MIAAICPNEAYIGAWDWWLSGKQRPFVGPKLPKIGPNSENPGQTLNRAMKRVEKLEQKTRGIDGGNDNHEARLEHARAFEKAALHYIVTNGLMNALMPIFALGPAWTVMRARSSYSCAERGEPDEDPFDSLYSDDASSQASQQRVKETDAILQRLDFWSGDLAFEDAFRETILKVAQRFERSKAEGKRDGRRHRSTTRIRNSIHPEASTETKEVLNGHRRGNRPPTRHDGIW